MSDSSSGRGPGDLTYPLRTAARLTGLSPEVLRAWERRHGVVEPVRTPGGTRRYTAADLDRLRLVKAAIDAGNRIGQVAKLEAAELERIASEARAPATSRIEEVMEVLERLDAPEAQRLLSLQLSALGPVRFAGDFVSPLVREIGARWARGGGSIASEHLATGVLRSLLGSALQPSSVSLRGPRIVFATPCGERHELGLLMAALVALGGGASPVYLGPEVPVEDLLAAVARARAGALALGLVSLAVTESDRVVGALRAGLPEATPIWLGGGGAREVAPCEGVERLDTLDRLEQRVELLVASDTRTR